MPATEIYLSQKSKALACDQSSQLDAASPAEVVYKSHHEVEESYAEVLGGETSSHATNTGRQEGPSESEETSCSETEPPSSMRDDNQGHYGEPAYGFKR